MTIRSQCLGLEIKFKVYPAYDSFAKKSLYRSLPTLNKALEPIWWKFASEVEHCMQVSHVKIRCHI